MGVAQCPFLIHQQDTIAAVLLISRPHGDNRPASAPSHVPGVPHATVAGLRGALVVAHLQVQLALVGPQLLLRKLPLVRVRHLGAERRTVVLGVLLSLGEVGESRSNTPP